MGNFEKFSIVIIVVIIVMILVVALNTWTEREPAEASEPAPISSSEEATQALTEAEGILSRVSTYLEAQSLGVDEELEEKLASISKWRIATAKEWRRVNKLEALLKEVAFPAMAED